MENNSKIIDGRAIAVNLFKDITERVGKLSFKPLLCDVVVGEDPVSLSYVNIKGKKAQECGMEFFLVQLPENSTEQEVITAIKAEQEKQNLCGLIVQLPLPQHLNSEKVLGAINPAVDVDFNNPPTVSAIMQILDSLQLNLENEEILVLGLGSLVGKPVSDEFIKRGVKFKTADQSTANKEELIKNASVIISGVGKAGILTGDQVSDGVIVIDAGTSESGGSIAGDADFETIAPKARAITPTPGGVGPVTVAKLLENVLIVAESRS